MVTYRCFALAPHRWAHWLPRQGENKPQHYTINWNNITTQHWCGHGICIIIGAWDSAYHESGGVLAPSGGGYWGLPCRGGILKKESGGARAQSLALWSALLHSVQAYLKEQAPGIMHCPLFQEMHRCFGGGREGGGGGGHFKGRAPENYGSHWLTRTGGISGTKAHSSGVWSASLQCLHGILEGRLWPAI